MYKGLYEYLEQCPQLKGRTFNFDFLGANPVRWSLRIPTNDPLLSKTISGDTHNKLDFLLVAVFNFGDDDMNNINNLEIFQRIKEWFVEQNNGKTYPNLGINRTVSGVYAQTDGYFENGTGQTGIYQIQCRAEYDMPSTELSNLPNRW